MTMIKQIKALLITKAEMNVNPIVMTRTTVATTRTGLNICKVERIDQLRSLVPIRLHSNLRLSPASWVHYVTQQPHQCQIPRTVWSALSHMRKPVPMMLMMIPIVNRIANTT